MLEKEIDPVCGMALNPHEALAQSAHKGKSYYFCSEECRQKFDIQPEKYVEARLEPELND
jgi:Cu+-exporting ATPase